MSKLLVIDVGNTHTVLGVYEGTTLLQHWRIQTEEGRTEDEYGVLIRSLLSGPEAAPSWLPHGGVVVRDDGRHAVYVGTGSASSPVAA